MEGREREVLDYKTALGALPFKEWRGRISDDATRIAIDVRIARFRGGNFGNSRSLGGGLFENKIDFGPGYRIYYATDGNKILLLCAGDKSSQDIDLKRAEKYLEDYKKREKERKATEKKENAKLQGRPPGRSKK
jgi:putative addiction module killer protein